MENLSNLISVIESKGSTIKIWCADHLAERSSSELSISTRARNCMLRDKWNTIDDVINHINSSRCRGLGVKTIKEIKTAILKFEYENYKPGKVKYLQKLAEINGLVD